MIIKYALEILYSHWAFFPIPYKARRKLLFTGSKLSPGERGDSRAPPSPPLVGNGHAGHGRPIWRANSVHELCVSAIDTRLVESGACAILSSQRS